VSGRVILADTSAWAEYDRATGSTTDLLRSPRALRRWLRRQPQVLDDGQADALCQVARRPGAWQLRRASAAGPDRAARRRGQP
jgi:hypothetical protein